MPRGFVEGGGHSWLSGDQFGLLLLTDHLLSNSREGERTVFLGSCPVDSAGLLF